MTIAKFFGDHMLPYSVIDLFCGAGGITRGFVDEGFNVIAGLDSDATCQYAYEYNNGAKFIHGKIEDFDPLVLRSLYPEGHGKILVGCAPCQPFSNYTKNKPTDDKWKLLSSFADVIDQIQPEIISMENVPELVTFKKGTVFNDFYDRLNENYEVSYHIVYCPDYGIPQRRTRLVLFASKFGKIDLVNKTHEPSEYRTVAQTIQNLEPLEAGQMSESDPMHRSRGLSELNMKRIKQSVPGGNWLDWDEELIATCHKKATGESYKSVYGRMAWNEPAPTITTQSYAYGSGRFGHPDQDRAISLREAALLQTFPPEYQFFPSNSIWSFETVGRHVGNAVPVALGRVIARSINEHLENIDVRRTITLSDEYQPQCT